MKKLVIFALAVMFITSFFYFVSAQQNETMVVEANIFAKETEADIISIEVPDYIFIGNVSEGEKTSYDDLIKVYVNNTGNVNITITPQLSEPREEIFSNLWFQSRKTGNSSQEYRIGDYSFDINAPSSGSFRSEYFYMGLDLTSINNTIIENDLIGYKANITFVALPKI
ncbi:MAG: hypothetical protein WC533_03290 [Candidatus Pacearchaeota archaeon]